MSQNSTPEVIAEVNSGKAPSSRMHDLDALRATAMLLGIVYHASLSFALNFPWLVQDAHQTFGMFLLQAGVHGFRMPLFFLISGFFTAMLWRSRGLKALVWHRFRRVLLPCLVGLITIVPITNIVIGIAFVWGSSPATKANRDAVSQADPWTAIKNGDVSALEKMVSDGIALSGMHPEFGITPLTWAAINGRTEMVLHLLDDGADPSAKNSDGGTALHAAAFFGQAEAVELLVEHGAPINAKNFAGETPLHNASTPLDAVQFIGGFLRIECDISQVASGRQRIVSQLKSLGAELQPTAGQNVESSQLRGWINWLIYNPVFSFLWFLWFLWLFVLAFAIYAVVMDQLGWKSSPGWLLISSFNLLWLVPVTMIPVWFMSAERWLFGPDTSMSIFPMPHVFLFYAMFFAFGALYFDCHDVGRRLGSSWKWLLPLTLLVVFPLGIEFTSGMFGFRDLLLPSQFHRPASVLLQSLYAWMMTFASIGLFYAVLKRENKAIRYMSDASYWLYLMHLPLVIIGQVWVKNWNVPAWFKVTLISLVVIGILLLVYDLMVRYTWIGTFLNGRRTRPRRKSDDAKAVGGSTMQS